ncbi:MAG: M6 family metalloprotease domain-containing protein [Gemmatimonadales bacterium]
MSDFKLAAGVALVAFGPAIAPAWLRAQNDVEELGRRFGAVPPRGYYETMAVIPDAFEFSRTNGWIRRGRAVASRRNLLRADGMSAAVVAPNVVVARAPAVAGQLNVPVFLILFANTDSAALVTNLPRSVMASRLYGTTPAPPYSVSTYYSEISNNSLTVSGQVFDWTRVPGLDSQYEGTGNGLDGTGDIPRLIGDIVAALDGTVDFGQFDNDGPDQIPNSGDDDGFVDAVVLIHPKVDGSCKNANPAAATSIWAHRFRVSAWSGSQPVATNDPSNSGAGNVRIDDYIIQGGQGGDTGCTSNQPQAMGVIAHETGHLFGLPDLYDTGNTGFGIGRWGIMGSGNQQVPTRPTHMSAWAKADLGWVTEVPITRGTTLVMSPVETSDTTYILPVPDSDEYFILENRQRIGSDSALIAPGLLIWHVDSLQVRLRRGFNALNAALPNAVALEQADGGTDLQDGVNKGDTGDPFPGSTSNGSFGRKTRPSSAANDGSYSFVELDSIAQVSPFGPVSVTVGFERPVLVEASDTNAVFRLDGVAYNRFEDFLLAGSVHTVDIDAVQLVDQGRRRYTWLSWSDGQPRSHSFTASPAGNTITANVASEFELKVTATSNVGSVSADAGIDLTNGTLLPSDSVVTLVANIDSAGAVFEQWLGPDTTATGDTLVVRMARPFTIDALFAARLVILDDTLPPAVMGSAYTHQVSSSGGTGTNAWQASSGTLPQGLTLGSDGVISGVPAQTGQFTLAVAVFSGSQTRVDTLTLNVNAPALAVEGVLKQLIGAESTLSDTDLRYLDLLGNDNKQLDVGDFLAWIEATGGSVTAAEMAAVLKAGGRNR